ncbi:MAG: hypothetical protein C0394_05680 [Syntrophus sp. (in: bacteria)]|nr:hypothetical protein [Syntrophus sp. (in: bacteria)]
MDIIAWFGAVAELEGALMEDHGDGRLSILFPERLQQRLQVGEMEFFGTQEHDADVGRLLHDRNPIVAGMGEILAAKGRFATAHLSGDQPRIPAPEAFLERCFTAQNFIYRYREQRIEPVSYLVVPLLLSAVSDMKTEQILTIVFNETTHTVPLGSENDLIAALPKALAAAVIVTAVEQTSVAAASLPAILARIKEMARRYAMQAFPEFLRSTERRMRRDLERLQEYYGAIAREIEKSAKKRPAGEEGQEKAVGRLEAARLEYEKKIQDVRDKYAVDLHAEPLGVLRLKMEAVVLHVQVQRRKQVMELKLPVNPLNGRLEALLCASCQSPTLNGCLCDKMHFLCRACHPDCRICRG